MNFSNFLREKEAVDRGTYLKHDGHIRNAMNWNNKARYSKLAPKVEKKNNTKFRNMA